MAAKPQIPGQLTLLPASSRNQPTRQGRTLTKRGRFDKTEAERIAEQKALPSFQAAIASLPHLRLQDPYGVIEGLSLKDLDSVSQWYFTSELDVKSAGTWVAVSSKAWGENFWNVSTGSEITFTYLMLLVVHKQMVLSGRTNGKDLFLLQNRLIRLIGDSFGNSFASTCPETALVICGLALFALREGNRETARAHMTAAQALSRMQYIQDAPCWTMCSWIDLFVSTAFAWHPFLPYQLPSPGQLSTSPTSQHVEEAHKRALRASKLVPLCQPGFDHSEAFELLSQVHQACFTADERHETSFATQNLLYDTVFKLCKFSCFTLGDAHSQLVVLAMQLCWLSAARFWMPQAGPLRPFLLMRLDTALQNSTEIITKWQKSSSLHSLLWIVLVMHQNSGRCMPDISFRALSVAKPVCQLLGITKLQELRRQLSSFPGVSSEKETALSAMWADIRPNATRQWIQVSNQIPPCQHMRSNESKTKKFVTIFQFETGALGDDDGPCCRHWMNNWGKNTIRQ